MVNSDDAGLLHQHLARLVQRVDVGGDAVAVLRQRLRQLVAVVALRRSRAPRGRCPCRASRSTKLFSCLAIGDADIEVAVGGQQDAVDAFLAEAALGQLVGELDARGAGGGSAGAQRVAAPAGWSAFSRTGVGASTWPAAPA